jgi:hypothetical protein
MWWEILIYIIAAFVGIIAGIFLNRFFSKMERHRISAKLNELLHKNLKADTSVQGAETGAEQVHFQQKLQEQKRVTIGKTLIAHEMENELLPNGLHEVKVELVVKAPSGDEQLKQLQEYLTQIPNCHLVLEGGSVETGSYFILSLNNPLLLMDQLKEFPIVDKIIKQGNKIGIMLK